MKKFYLSVLAAAVAVTACDKSETINLQENKQQEVAFSPISMPATKAPITTTAFPDDNIIYVSASNNKVKFFEDKTFKKDVIAGVWKNYEAGSFSPIYGPLGGGLDFLAYSTTLAATAKWGDGNLGTDDDVAGVVAITYPSNYTAVGANETQDDLLYATTSSSSSSAVPIEFKHALSWVNFMVKSNIQVNISKIELVNVYTEGKFIVDQTYNTPQTSWDFNGKTPSDKAILNYVDDSTPNANASFDIDGSAGKEVNADHVFGDMGILVPAQPIPSFKITYDFGGADLVYICKNARGTWESGKKYTYKINIEFKDITLAPTVTIYDIVTDMPINL